MTVKAPAKKTPPSSGKAKPEATTKKNPRVTVEEVTDDEADFGRKTTPGKKKLYNPRAPKGVRFEDVEVGGTEAPKGVDRPYVLVPPLPSSYKTGPPHRAQKPKEAVPLPVLDRKAPAFKRQAPIEESESMQRIMEELLNTKFTTSLKDLASISAPAREYLRKMITRRKVAVDSKASDLEFQLIALIDLMSTEQQNLTLEACTMLERFEEAATPQQTVTAGFMQVEDLPPAQVFMAEGLSNVPDGSFVVSDPVEQYLNSLAEDEEPRPIVVARESIALRTVYPIIHRSARAEVLLDTGSQICSMDVEVARSLGLTWDPDVVIHLQSANRTTEKTLGLARNVEFDFGGVSAYIQLHIIRRPAYDVLLGRPFDVTMSSEVTNQPNGDQVITLKDPNSGKKVTLSTYPRGKPPPFIEKELRDMKERNFLASRI